MPPETGAQQGIGPAIALAYGREGAGVVVNDLDHAGAAEAIVAEIRGAGGPATTYYPDKLRRIEYRAFETSDKRQQTHNQLNLFDY